MEGGDGIFSRRSLELPYLEFWLMGRTGILGRIFIYTGARLSKLLV